MIRSPHDHDVQVAVPIEVSESKVMIRDRLAIARTSKCWSERPATESCRSYEWSLAASFRLTAMVSAGPSLSIGVVISKSSSAGAAPRSP
jgi:hypothetical protein